MDWRKLPRPYRRTGKMVNCAFCGKTIYRPAWQLRNHPISYCSLSCRAKKVCRVHPINFDFFNNWTFDLAYLLGLFIADGCVRDNGFINFTSLDKVLLDFFRDKVSPTTPITDKGKRICLWSVDLRDKLASFGITPRKSLTVNFPFIPDDFIPDFIRGFLDGDGHIDKLGRISFSSGSKNFLIGLQNAFIPLDIYSNLYKGNRCYILYLRVGDSIKLANFIYNGNFCLTRKKDRARFK